LAFAGLAIGQTVHPLGPLQCDPALTALFTPRRPQLGRYEACTSEQPLSRLVRDGWIVDTVGPLDALGRAGRYNRARVARLYGGQRATVARGSVQHDRGFEAITLITPYPNRDLTALETGTLVIRYFVFE
jgi:hypothetical protein